MLLNGHRILSNVLNSVMNDNSITSIPWGVNNNFSSRAQLVWDTPFHLFLRDLSDLFVQHLPIWPVGQLRASHPPDKVRIFWRPRPVEIPPSYVVWHATQLPSFYPPGAPQVVCTFPNSVGYWGAAHPTTTTTTISSRWILFSPLNPPSLPPGSAWHGNPSAIFTVGSLTRLVCRGRCHPSVSWDDRTHRLVYCAITTIGHENYKRRRVWT